MTIQTPIHPAKSGTLSLMKLKQKVVCSLMPKGHGLALVVPCYNEAKRLDVSAFKSFLDEHPEVRVVFVNDGSKDDTLTILKNLSTEMPEQVDVIDLAKNSGKAEAVRQGLIHASMTGIDLLGYWDADLATPLNAVMDFVTIAERVTHIDVIFGSRRMMLGHQIERTIGRRIVSRLCAQLARLALRLPIGDTQCGAKLLRNTKAVRTALKEPFTAGWLFDVELFSRIANATKDRNRAFYELPLAEWNEIPGSKVSAKAIVKAGLKMLDLIAQNRLGLPAKKGKAAVGTYGTLIRSSITDVPVVPHKIDKAA